MIVKPVVSSPGIPILKSLSAKLKKQWFMVGILVVILSAYAYPPIGQKYGLIHSEITVKYGAVFGIFLNSGLALRVAEMSKAVSRFKLIGGILATNMFVVPLFAIVAVRALRLMQMVEDAVLTGFLVVSCMPPPVSSAVILTRAVGGNDAVAICASAIGSFLGLLVTPATLLVVTGIQMNTPVLEIMMKLGMTVILPLLLGQAIRYKMDERIAKYRIPHSFISNILLLLIIYSTFCNTFSQNLQINAQSLLVTCVFIVLFQSVLLYSFWKIGDRLLVSSEKQDSKQDVIAIMFCCSHKSLTLGIPLLKIMYEGNPLLSILSIPLLIYQPTQILLGSTLVEGLKTWLRTTGTDSSYTYEKVSDTSVEVETPAE